MSAGWERGVGPVTEGGCCSLHHAAKTGTGFFPPLQQQQGHESTVNNCTSRTVGLSPQQPPPKASPSLAPSRTLGKGKTCSPYPLPPPQGSERTREPQKARQHC